MHRPVPARMPKRSALSIGLALLLLFLIAAPSGLARKRSHSHGSSTHRQSSRQSHTQSRSRRHSSAAHHGRHHVTHQHSTRHAKAASKTRYAYPLEIFMLSPPVFDRTPLPVEEALKLRHDFDNGIAEGNHPNDLVRAGIVLYHPLHGGIFKRRQPVKYIIVHSTETGPPVSAISVIDAWGSLGRRHAGAQYVVERDGRIYQSCEPDLATVHVNIFKTLPGINNDNSIGIEMNHTGRQTYPPEQRSAVIRLVSYLQNRYHVLDSDIITHKYAQQGDHTDPVLFDFEAFLATKEDFHARALASKRQPPASAPAIADIVAPEPTVYLEMHKSLPEPVTDPAVTRDTAFRPKDQQNTLLPRLRTEIELAPDRATIEQQQLEQEHHLRQQQRQAEEQEQEREQLQLEPQAEMPNQVP